MGFDYHNDEMNNGYADLPEGLNIIARCERSHTGSFVTMRVPKHIGPNQFGDWCLDNGPVGFVAEAVAIATDEQCEAMGY